MNVMLLPRARLAVLVGLAALVHACAPARPMTPADRPGGPGLVLPDSVRIRVAGVIRDIPLDAYVAGTALSEVSPVGENAATAERIFNVQTIIARTYAASHLGRHRQEGFDLCDTTHCQVYQPARLTTSRFGDVARRAALRTRAEVVMYGQRLAEALFHADCGGHTADANHIWGGAAVPYLTAHPDALPAGTHRTWTFDTPAERVREALAANPLSDVGNRLDRIEVLERDPSGRAARIELRGEKTRVLRGEQVRAILNQTFGPRAILSTRFTVTGTRTEYHFEGTGYGHGVGLCQVGAAARARRGDSEQSILEAYYPGARLSRVR